MLQVGSFTSPSDWWDTALDRIQQNDPDMTDINWSNLELGLRGITELSHSIESNTELQSINISGNSFGDIGTKYIVQAVLHRSTVNDNGLVLNVGRNGITDDGIKLLAYTIPILHGLDVSSNPFGFRSIQHIAEQLKNPNTTLRSLNLSYTNVGDIGITFVADALKVNRSLRSLQLNHSYITDTGIALLRDVLENSNSTSLIELSLNDNVTTVISKSNLDYLQQLVQANKEKYLEQQ